MIRHFPRRDYNLHPKSDTHIEFFLLNSLIVSFIIPSHSVLKLNFSLLFSPLIPLCLRIAARTALSRELQLRGIIVRFSLVVCASL